MIFYVVELSDDWNVDVPSWKYPRNLESPRVSSPGFGNDSKMMVIITKAENISKFFTNSHREVLTTVPKNDNICTHKSALKPFETAKPNSVDTQLLPMAVLPPLEKQLLQSWESDADAEMSSSSLSEEDALEYDMYEDLEDSPAVISPPPSSKPENQANTNR
ncbi:hypothetical protein AVEN_98690-1 [Araneus ventricosus]|uniref:Uncharacterized protein n=2 Tax=Araneus ventricosus TaxID=182803 RepID=A0A4Y2X6P5_ARAVE|nr:hypothetical protein AVEN_98690-1 [Araneus ventricosus]